VLLFPSNAQAWTDAGPNSRHFRTTRPNARGEFVLSGVPPGDYYVVAVPDEQSGDWRDPGVLDSLARAATSIGVSEGETKAVTIRVKDVR
jgi:hypothetical protein